MQNYCYFFIHLKIENSKYSKQKNIFFSFLRSTSITNDIECFTWWSWTRQKQKSIESILIATHRSFTVMKTKTNDHSLKSSIVKFENPKQSTDHTQHWSSKSDIQFKFITTNICNFLTFFVFVFVLLFIIILISK